MKNVLASIFFVLTMLGCTDDDEAIRALTDQGFNNVSITDRGFVMTNMYGCDEKDGAYYRATATNPRGTSVNVVVCCGGPLQFKGCTIRSK